MGLDYFFLLEVECGYFLGLSLEELTSAKFTYTKKERNY